MTMQYDVKSAHLNQSGFLTLGNRSRLKQLTYAGNGSQAGSVAIFDTLTPPTSAVYQRTGNLITVTSSAHGLSNGTQVGIAFNVSSGLSGTDGNFTIANVTTNTFTITDVNSGNTSGGIGCSYVVAFPTGDTRYQNEQRWLMQVDTVAGQTATQQVLIPGEGMLAENGVYAQLTYIGFVSAFYG